METKAIQTSALAFFVLALGWSSAFWAAAARWGTRDDPTESILFLLGGAGPLVAAVALTHLREAAPTRRDFWVRAIDPRRLHWPWWVAALLLHPVLIAFAFAMDVAAGGSLPPVEMHGSSVSSVLSLLVFLFWFGPFPEEIAWRGFALDRLQGRMTALHASLILGSVWALWHVPLFLLPGTFQAGLGLGSFRSWMFLLSMVPLSVLMTWVYNNTNRSTLSAVLIHYSGNVCGAFLEKTDRVAALELALLSLAAALVVMGWGARHLRR